MTCPPACENAPTAMPMLEFTPPPASSRLTAPWPVTRRLLPPPSSRARTAPEAVAEEAAVATKWQEWQEWQEWRRLWLWLWLWLWPSLPHGKSWKGGSYVLNSSLVNSLMTTA